MLATSIGFSASTLFWVGHNGIVAAGAPSGVPGLVYSVSVGTTVSPQALAVSTTPSGSPDLFFSNELTANLYHVTKTGSVWSGIKLLPNSKPSPPNFWYPYSTALDTTQVYMTSFTGEVWSLPRSTTVQTAPTILTTGINNRSLIATNGTRVFYVRGTDIVRMPVTGGAETTFYAGAGTVSALALSGGELFWGSTTTGTVMKKPLAGGAAATVVSGVSPAALGGVDASRIYFNLSGSFFSLTH
jgi:hypothetical protein